MERTNIVFYENFIDENIISSRLDLKQGKWLFINIKEFKEKKNIYQRFYENEFLSISFFKKLINRFKIIKKVIEKVFYKKEKTNETLINQSLLDFKQIQHSQLTEFASPEIYKKIESLTVEFFDKIKEKTLIKERFQYDNISLYEINRLEFVNFYHENLLNLFSVNKLIETLQPHKIYLLPSLKILNILIVNSVAKKEKIPVIKFNKEIIENRRIFFKSLKNTFRLLLERIWYWNAWKLLNRKSIKLKYINGNKKINFIFTHYKNHFPTLLPLLKELNVKTGIINILYVPHKLFSYSKLQIKRANLENVKILPYSFKNYGTFRRRYKLLKKNLFHLVKPSSFADIKYELINFSSLIKISFLFLHEKLVQSLQYLENIKQILKALKPDMICMFSGNDPIDLLGTHISKRMNLPSLFIPHAIGRISYEYSAFEQDYIVCAGNKEKDYFTSLGTKSQNIYVLGIPLYDTLFNKFSKLGNTRVIRNNVIKHFKLNPDNKIILLVTTHHEDFIRERVFKSVIDMYNNIKNCHLIVKIHPIDELSYYQGLLENYIAENVDIVKDFDLHNLIIASDLIIGRSTGAQLEAIFLDKNVVDINYETSFDVHLVRKFKAVLTAYSPIELGQVVKKALHDKDTSDSLKRGMKKYREYCVSQFDGNASFRIKNIIEKILNH